MKRQITGGDWKVGQNVAGEGADGLVVMSGLHVVADCRNDYLAATEQRGNATLCAAAPRMLEMLRECEQHLGDRPSSDKAAARMHANIVALLSAEGLL